MKMLNIEMNVRRMEAQNILTTSVAISTTPTDEVGAPARGGVVTSADGGVAPVRAGF